VKSPADAQEKEMGGKGEGRLGGKGVCEEKAEKEKKTGRGACGGEIINGDMRGLGKVGRWKADYDGGKPRLDVLWGGR